MLKRLMVAGVVVFLATAAGAAYAADTLKIATLAPDSTTWMKSLREAGAEIARRTDGRVKFKYYPGGVMGNDQAVLRKIRIGQLHGGAVTSGALADIFPDAQIYSLPMQFRSIEEVNYVRNRMDEAIRKGLKKHGLITLGISNGGFVYLASQASVSGIDDLKDQRVWIPHGDEVAGTMFKAAGISPVPLPLPDVYTALQTGLLDTVIANPSSMIAFQWHTKIDYVTDAPLALVVGMFVVDRRAFEKLDEADRAVVREVMQVTFAELDALNHRDNMAAREVLSTNGVKFVQPGEQEHRRWRETAEASLGELQQKGEYTQEFLSMLHKYLLDYRHRVAEQ